MIRILLVLSLLSIYTKASSSEPVVMPGKVSVSPIQELYDACGLKGKLSFDAFQKCLEGFTRYKPAKSIIAICDFSKPSDQKRFFVIDLIQKKTLAYTYVAHGKNSGEKMATSFSNQPESLKSSLGFFKVGQPIETLKHGMSLILDGLEKGKNDNARAREIIIHGATYVSDKFVQQYGYTGKSFGCPALPQDVMKEMLPLLANGSLLYIYR